MRYTDDVKFEKAIIGKDAICIDVEPCWVPVPFQHSPLWARMHRTFSTENFLYACPPVDIGLFRVDTEDLLGLRVLRCPIKPSGTMSISLPAELLTLAPLVRYLAELEAHVNPRYGDFWCHISVERTNVSAGSSQRVPGWHVDGFQGIRVAPHQIEHSYLWADHQHTEFCVQPFYVSHLDPGRHNVFNEFARQAREENALGGLDGHIYLIDPYVVHRSPVLKRETVRTFVRVTFTETELEDPVNTVNLSLPGSQDYARRIDVRDRLTSYDGAIPWEMYGVRPLEKL